MRVALQQAREAAESGEVPVGAVIAKGMTIAGRAHNQVELLRDPTAHAELIAITQAAACVGDWRLSGLTLYVTKEPCPMCAGAIMLARLSRVVFGVSDPRQGGMSAFGILNDPRLNHSLEVQGGVVETECRELLQAFFRKRRAEPADAKPKGGPDREGVANEHA